MQFENLTSNRPVSRCIWVMNVCYSSVKYKSISLNSFTKIIKSAPKQEVVLALKRNLRVGTSIQQYQMSMTRSVHCKFNCMTINSVQMRDLNQSWIFERRYCIQCTNENPNFKKLGIQMFPAFNLSDPHSIQIPCKCVIRMVTVLRQHMDGFSNCKRSHSNIISIEIFPFKVAIKIHN